MELLQQPGSLRVDTGPLEAILQSLTEKTRYHERQISRLNEFERVQSKLREDTNKLTLQLSSRQSLSSLVNDDGSAQEDISNDHTAGGESSSPSEANPRTSKRLGWDRVRAVTRTQQNEKAEATLRQLQKEVVGVKAIVQQLQKEQDEDLASSMQADESIAALKIEILDLHRDLASSATMKHIRDLKQLIQQSQIDTERFVSEHENTSKAEIDANVKKKLVEIKSWFTDLESMIRQRQSKLDTRIASVAKASDLTALKDCVENEAIEVSERLEFLSNSADKTTESLQALKDLNAIAAMTKCYHGWRRRSRQQAWSTWVAWLKAEDETRSKFLARSRLTRKVVTQLMLGKKKRGFLKWIEVLSWQRRIEARKEAAVKLMHQRLFIAVTEPTQKAFNRWRRRVIIERINDAYETKEVKTEPIKTSSIKGHDEREMADKGNVLASTQNDTQSHDMTRILNALKHDAHGSAQALAQEIQNVRTYDIGRLRSDWEEERQRQSESIDEITSEAMSTLTSRATEFERRVDRNLHDFSKEFPGIRADISQLRTSLTGTSNRVKNIEENHGERIELLFEHKEAVDERLIQLESRLRRADDRIKTLEQGEEKSSETITMLLDKMVANEIRHEEHKQKLEATVSRFEGELNRIQTRLQNSEARQVAVKADLDTTESRLGQHESITQKSIDRMNSIIDAPGLRRPKLDKMRKLCSLYETVAKEKNYVVAINSVNDGHMDVDIPAHMADFSHDYAAWIAYQADHEAITRVIAGTNPEDFVYAEEDTAPRRIALLEGLKSDLSEALESLHPEAGALRLEARTKFLARLIEATNSALSKHDQILIDATTRIGRVRASVPVPVCVACDRPLRNKGRQQGKKGKTNEHASSDPVAKVVPGSSSPAKVATESKTPINSRTVPMPPQPADKQQFVMRGGFKMPKRMSSGEPVQPELCLA